MKGKMMRIEIRKMGVLLLFWSVSLWGNWAAPLKRIKNPWPGQAVSVGSTRLVEDGRGVLALSTVKGDNLKFSVVGGK